MKTKVIPTLLVIFILTITCSHGQKISLDENKKSGTATKSEVLTMQCSGEIATPTADLKWKPVLIKKRVSFEPKRPNEELIESLKKEKLKQKFSGIQSNQPHEDEPHSRTVTPVVGTNFLGNENNGSSPMDNSIAISNGGIIISVANTTIEIDNSSGTNLYYNDIATFFDDPLINVVCDPVILYDKLADRFIFFAQECSGGSSNSNLLICFSKTNNPATDGWWKYKLTGNPLNNNCWFDYPKMAISNNELYITGNLFTDGGSFNQAILYQIDKVAAYSGLSVSWQYWSNIAGSPFTLLPVGDGQGLSYTPGCYLVSTSASGASAINLYDLTNDISASNEQLNYYSVSTTAYSPSADASQSGTSCMLDNGDCRALSGFYLNGIIHFVFHSDIGNGWNGINYNRLTLSSSSNQSSMYGQMGSYDYSYPSISSYATAATDKSVMISFGRAGASIFPEMRVINCDNNMTWSSSTLVKSSSSFVSYTSSSNERWGDYTGISRKHNSPSPSVWVNGMYATSSNLWNTWIAEVHHTSPGVGISESEAGKPIKLFPNPVSSTFTIEFNLIESADIKIAVYDISGKMIKELFDGKGQAGDNVFSFNTSNLSSGSYFLSILKNSNLLKNEKIIISK